MNARTSTRMFIKKIDAAFQNIAAMDQWYAYLKRLHHRLENVPKHWEVKSDKLRVQRGIDSMEADYPAAERLLRKFSAQRRRRRYGGDEEITA